MIDFAQELKEALVSPAVREALSGIVRDALREEVPSAPADPDRLIDVDGAAQLLGMTPAAVRKATERGALPCHRIGRRVRFRAGDLLFRDRSGKAGGGR